MAVCLLFDFLEDFRSVLPSRILDQHVGMGLTSEDLLIPLTFSPLRRLPRGRYYRPWHLHNMDFGSTINYGKDKFQVNLDVQQFTPEEIKVKVIDGSVIVEAKHEEKQDEHGFISRQFVRRYVLPIEYEIENVQSSLSSDGILTITAPKCNAIEDEERVIPVKHSGPHKDAQQQEKMDQQKNGEKQTIFDI